MLTLYEELFLLSINDATGELVGAAASYLPYGLAGAMLAELALQRKVNVADGTNEILRHLISKQMLAGDMDL